MTSLITLPNGNAVAPASIVSIEAIANAKPYRDDAGAEFLARVLIETSRGGVLRIACKTYAEAVAMRDALIAELVHHHRGRQPGPAPAAAAGEPAKTE